MTWRRGDRLALIGGVWAMLAASLAPPAAAADTASSRLAQSPGAVRSYWTPARMRAAEPAELRASVGARRGLARAARDSAVDQSADNTGFPQRVHGKVFLTIEEGSQPGDFVCSGTAVTSNSHTVVWTAGHCVNDAQFGGGFASSWQFVPGYRNGEQPFGSWPAKELLTTRDWKQDANVRADLGAALVARDAQGRGVQDVVGTRGIVFAAPREQAYTAFGYPALPALLHPEFDGERLYSCESPLSGADNPPGRGPAPLEIDCDMTGGSSGGGWVVAGGDIASVISYGYAGDVFHLYGPYQGATARALYEDASGQPLLCAGAQVTNLGSAGRNRYVGGDGADVFKLGGRPDEATGALGTDRACGGGGRDRLRGDDGDDVLRGGGGRDLLIGGPGDDVCDGGPGRDRTRSCEDRTRVP